MVAEQAAQREVLLGDEVGDQAGGAAGAEALEAGGVVEGDAGVGAGDRAGAVLGAAEQLAQLLDREADEGAVEVLGVLAEVDGDRGAGEGLQDRVGDGLIEGVDRIEGDASARGEAVDDVNKDDIIDGGDLSQVENDAGLTLSGYVSSDVTGDDFVDAADISVVENNVANGVIVLSP